MINLEKLKYTPLWFIIQYRLPSTSISANKVAYAPESLYYSWLLAVMSILVYPIQHIPPTAWTIAFVTLQDMTSLKLRKTWSGHHKIWLHRTCCLQQCITTHKITWLSQDITSYDMTLQWHFPSVQTLSLIEANIVTLDCSLWWQSKCKIIFERWVHL